MELKDETRETIITVAIAIFSRFGFRKTTMDDIAMAAGKGKSSIYYYFKSKEDVFKAVVEKEAGLMKNKLQLAIGGFTDPKDQLKAYINTRMKGFEELVNFYQALKDDYLKHLDFIETIRNKYDKEEIDIVENILKEGVLNYNFDLQDTRLGAIAIVTALKGIEIPLFVTGNYNNVQERLEHLLNILLYGLIRS